MTYRMVAAGALGLGNDYPPAKLREPYIKLGMDILVVDNDNDQVIAGFHAGLRGWAQNLRDDLNSSKQPDAGCKERGWYALVSSGEWGTKDLSTSYIQLGMDLLLVEVVTSTVMAGFHSVIRGHAEAILKKFNEESNHG